MIHRANGITAVHWCVRVGLAVTLALFVTYVQPKSFYIIEEYRSSKFLLSAASSFSVEGDSSSRTYRWPTTSIYVALCLAVKGTHS